MRSSRERVVGRGKRKAEEEAEAATPRALEDDRQAKLEQALLQQLEMQKKLHEQLEVCASAQLDSSLFTCAGCRSTC